MKNYINYTVNENDTLYSVAKKHNVTVNEILDYNLITNGKVKKGDTLVIPLEMKLYETYITEEESVKDILKKENISLESFLLNNKVEDLFLMKNQLLKIPTNEKEYVIKEDDTIDDIIKNTNKSSRHLMYLNKHNWLKSGNVIKY